MKFSLIIDPAQEESVTVRAHQPSPLTEQLRQLVLGQETDRIPLYDREDAILLPIRQIACITVLDGKTWVIDTQNRHLRSRQRLYELEALLPPSFLRLSKSAIGNEKELERFAASFSGAVDAVFRCGHREYVSRRCFSQIKRRYGI